MWLHCVKGVHTGAQADGAGPPVLLARRCSRLGQVAPPGRVLGLQGSRLGLPPSTAAACSVQRMIRLRHFPRSGRSAGCLFLTTVGPA